MPPEENTKPESPTRWRRLRQVAAMSAGSSGTTSTRTKSTPREWSSLASQGVLASVMLPASTSSPMIISAAFTGGRSCAALSAAAHLVDGGGGRGGRGAPGAAARREGRPRITRRPNMLAAIKMRKF